MYTIRANGGLIYDPRVDELKIISASLSRENNTADNFTFSPALCNIAAQNLPKLSTIIEVFDDDERIFRGRILNMSQDLNNIFSYECEGELAFFTDSVVRPYDWSGGAGGVEAYFRFLVNQHNEQVDNSKRFTVRNVTVTGDNENIVRGSAQYPDTLSELREKLPSLLGGHFFIERIGGTSYIDYLAESPFTSKQKIRLGSNIIDLLNLERGIDVATAIIPLGERIVDEYGHELGRLTIAAVNGGVDYIEDAEAVAMFGFRVKPVIHDNVTLPQNLLANGMRDLAEAVNPLYSIEVSVVDLALLGIEAEKIRFLDFVEVDSPIHGLSGTLLITKMNTDLLDPAKNTITIGSDYGTFARANTSVAQRVISLENNTASTEAMNRAADAVERVQTELAPVMTALRVRQNGGTTEILLNATDDVFASTIRGTTLWSGSSVVGNNDTITPSVPLNRCPNGWCLIWADVDILAPISYMYIHKFTPALMRTAALLPQSNGGQITKEVWHFNGNIMGRPENAINPNDGKILIEVIAF